VRDIEKTLGKAIEKRRLGDFNYDEKTPAPEHFAEAKRHPHTPPGKKPEAKAHDTRPKKTGKPRRRRFRGHGR